MWFVAGLCKALNDKPRDPRLTCYKHPWWIGINDSAEESRHARLSAFSLGQEIGTIDRNSTFALMAVAPEREKWLVDSGTTFNVKDPGNVLASDVENLMCRRSRLRLPRV